MHLRHVLPPKPVAGLSVGRSYEMLELRSERSWQRQKVLVRDDTNAEGWHPRSLFVPDFSLWLEFEHWEEPPPLDRESDFFNMKITLADGRIYAANTWTYAVLASLQSDDAASGENLAGSYLLPPDLFVARMERKLLENVVTDLLVQHHWELPASWQVPPRPEEDGED